MHSTCIISTLHNAVPLAGIKWMMILCLFALARTDSMGTAMPRIFLPAPRFSVIVLIELSEALSLPACPRRVDPFISRFVDSTVDSLPRSDGAGADLLLRPIRPSARGLSSVGLRPAAAPRHPSSSPPFFRPDSDVKRSLCALWAKVKNPLYTTRVSVYIAEE